VSRLRPALESACVLTFFAAAAVLFNWGAWQDPSARYLGVGGDVVQSIWFMAWTPHALAHHLNPFLTDALNYPATVNLTWQTSQPLLGLLSAPLAAAFGMLVAYNVMVTAAIALSGWTAFIALRRFTSSRAGALGGAVFYAFSPYVAGQSLGHSNLIWIGTLPLLLLVLDDVMRTQRRRWWINGVLLAAIALSQLLISEEILAIDVISIGVVVVVSLFYSRARKLLQAAWPQLWRSSLMGLILLIGVGAWPLATQLFGPNRLTGSPQGTDISSGFHHRPRHPSVTISRVTLRKSSLTSGFHYWRSG
jgi:hypothetical protein